VLSRYIFFGRRKAFRRGIDRQKGGYVDRYSTGMFIVLIIIIVSNVFDSLLTMAILNRGGEEVNPIVSWAIEAYGNKFWIWKFLITSFCLTLLCLHSQIGRFKAFHATIAISFIYVIVLLYQIHMILWQ
jgi:hypothetical protein